MNSMATVSILERLRARVRGRPAAPSGPGPFQGYIDERSTNHVAGWLRNLSDPADRVTFEVVVPGNGSDRIVHRGVADRFSEVLVLVDVGDGRYAFDVTFEVPLTTAERDGLFVRPAGALHRLELAPALKSSPRSQSDAAIGQAAPAAVPVATAKPQAMAITAHGPFQGYIDERSTHHVSGWIRDLSDLSARVPFEIVTLGERVLHRGVADSFSNLLVQIGVGDGLHAFYLQFAEPLTPAERDALFVRPTGSAHRLELAPSLKAVFEPISHIAMDIVNNCNLRCPFCVFDYANTRATKLMTDETFDAALRLIPYVTDGNFWLSCLHEATLHPRLTEFVGRVPQEYRRKLFYTTNLAKPMKPDYFAFLANSGMHHINVSVESLDPVVYEKMRKGARHRIFTANWQKLLEALPLGSAPPLLRYNLMAYRSNLAEIPGMVELLLRERMAWQVEIRHTYDEPHIPSDFRDSEFLTTQEWAWLAAELAHHSPERVLLLLPPHGVGFDVNAAPEVAVPVLEAVAEVSVGDVDDSASIEAVVEELADEGVADAGVVTARRDITAPGHRYDRIPRPLQISMDWEGTLRVYGEEPRGPGQPPQHVNYLMTNITYLRDPLKFLLTL